MQLDESGNLVDDSGALITGADSQTTTGGQYWWLGPPPPGWTGDWPPKLGPGQSYGPNLGQINGPGSPADATSPFVPGATIGQTLSSFGTGSTATPPPPSSPGGIGGAQPPRVTQPTPVGAPVAFGSFLAPFTEKFTPVAEPAPFSYPAFDRGAPFVGPTAVTEQNDPGYQFRLKQGEQALESSAAARGLLNTGGTLKDVLQYGQDYASGEFKNVYDRARSDYEMNLDDRLRAYEANYGVAADTFGKNFAVNQDQFARNWNQYLQDFQIWQRNQDAPFSKLLAEQQVGVGAAY